MLVPFASDSPLSRERPNIDFIFFDAGGGHRSAANALEAVIAEVEPNWAVRLVNLQEVLDPLDVFRKLTGIRLQDLYNKMLARGWTLGSAAWLPIMQWVIRRYHKPSVELLAEFWRKREPDMVVSLIPNLNRAAFQGLRKVSARAPYVTILTDLADYPPHFWIERQAQHLVCGTERAAQQARRQGYGAEAIHEVSGMILRPVFYEERREPRRPEREAMGLNGELPTALVMFGGEGSSVMERIAERLGNSQLHLQMIMICGKNEKLRARLDRMTTRNRMAILGFTKEVPRYMAMADFFIGKPGPGSISEALQMGLPAIVEANAWTLPQERYNTVWLKEKGYGMVLRNFTEIEDAVKQLLRGGTLNEWKGRVSKFDDRALFEIPPILRGILEGSRTASATAPPAKSAVDSGG